MAANESILVSIPKVLFDQAEMLAQQLTISQSQLFEMAIADFIRNDHNQVLNEQPKSSQYAAEIAPQGIINQGDIYWVKLEDGGGSESRIPHPHVIIQDNVINHSRINTVVACALTTNIKRANTPGNVLLDVGEANLPKQSVVETSKVSTLAKAQLGIYIGSLSEQRLNQILAGMRFLQRSYFER